MATTDPPQTPYHVVEIDDHEFSGDEESDASNETDDGFLHAPEKILGEDYWNAEAKYYLVKWKDCAIVRSSWEEYNSLLKYPQLLADWKVEKEKQLRGESVPFDFRSFNRLRFELEEAGRRKRTLRRLKRHIQRVLSIVDV